MTDLFHRNRAPAIALAVFIAQGILSAGETPASVRAEALYKQGNFAEAVATAEEEYSKTGDRELKTSLIKYLTELGLDLSFKENYSAASYAFRRALTLAPDDLTLKELAVTAKDLSSYGEIPESPKKETRPIAPLPQKAAVNNTYLKQQKALILKLEKLAEAIEKKSAPPSAISEDTIRKIAASINKVISEAGANIKKTFMVTAVAGTAAIAVLIVSAFLIARYAVNRYHMLNFSIKNSVAELDRQKKARRIPIISPRGDTKYEGIDIIEAELSSEDSTEACVAKKLLEPFLNDTDIELKIRAIKALHKYSKDEACVLLEQEALKGGDGIKIFCRLIQLLPPEKSVAIAEEIMKKTEASENSLMANALLKINTPDLDEKLRDKINSLAGISGNDDWIVS